MKNKLKANDIIKDNKGQAYQALESAIDDNGNNVLLVQKMPEWISPTKLKLGNGKIISYDPNEACFEVYNPNKHKVIFVNTHYNPEERLITPQKIIVEPDGFGFIPHKYYIPYLGYEGNKTGEKFDMVINSGDMMFKGNKLPSRPDYQRKLY